jgi:pimeloyl-ACP methyl ester carboxylesterase
MAAPGAVELWDERIRVAASRGMAPLVEPTVQRWFTPEFIDMNPPALQNIRRMIRDTPAAGYIAGARALQRYDFRDEAALIRVPLLLIAGAADGALPAVMRAMHAGIPGSEFIEVPAAGHLPNVERADVFNAALTHALNS